MMLQTRAAVARASVAGAVRGRWWLAARVALLVACAALFAFLSSPQLARSIPRYEAGDRAATAVRAPYRFSLVDEEATRAKQAQALAAAPLVTVLRPGVPAALLQTVADAFNPLIDLLARRQEPVPESPAGGAGGDEPADSRSAQAVTADEIRLRIPALENALGIVVSPEVEQLIARNQSLTRLQLGLRVLVEDTYRTPLAADLGPARRALARQEGDPAGPDHLVVRDPASGAERRLSSIAELRDLASARAALPSRAAALLADQPPAARSLIVAIVSAQLRPNLQVDDAATAAGRDAAAAAVIPVSLQFDRNQLVVAEGQTVTRETQAVLEYLRNQKAADESPGRMTAKGAVMFLLLLVGSRRIGRGRARAGIAGPQFWFSVSLIAASVLGFRAWLLVVEGVTARFTSVPELPLVLLFPFAAPAIYARLVLRGEEATLPLAVRSIVLGLIWHLDLLLAAFVFVAGHVGGQAAARCDRRQCVLRAGLSSGLAAVPVAAGLWVLHGEHGAASVLFAVAAAVAGGLVAGGTVLALGPAGEWLFRHTTNIRLVELMNYHHPLLRRLLEEVPGTFQHSVTIGVLGDAAARAIRANALLVRVGALYHDAGKTRVPAAFIENQAGANMHETLPPHESARLILDHVPEGVRLVRQYRLDERIADFVREHHGTSVLRHFMRKAVERGEDASEAEFRYPGPRPRSRETAILMIADQVEATARTLSAPGPDDFRAMTQQTIERLLAERQLDECPLTLKDLAAIREAMVRALAGIHHRRVTYPGQERKHAGK